MRPQTFAATWLALAGLACATPVHAQDFRWTMSEGNDPTNKGRYTAYLTQGIPETDNAALRATCAAGSSGREIPLILIYNTGGLANGSPVSLSFFKNGRQVHHTSGQVYHAPQEEGISGVLTYVSARDRIWDMLKRGRYVRYEANGLGKAGMHLNQSRPAIERFLATCGRIWNAQPDGLGHVDDDRENEETNVAGAKSCRLWGSVKSVKSQQPVRVRFINRTARERTVMWLDYQGQPTEHRRLAPGASYTQETFASHPWMFTDAPGNCKEIYIPHSGPNQTYALTFDR